MKIKPGKPYPLGATWDGHGVNFSLFSEHATRVELCLFDAAESESEALRIPIEESTDQVWHVYVTGLQPGQLYGFRVDGPYDPLQGLRFNNNKVLLDPYAKAIGRVIDWSDAMFGYRIGDEAADLSFDTRDNASEVPLAAVVETAFTWGDDRPPNTPWHKTFIYELHVKGFTRLQARIPAGSRGTYAGLATEAAIDHLRNLGVTAVELMPVHFHSNDRYLTEKGLSNYWGYNSLSFFAPDPRYARGLSPNDTVREFKTMVRAMHLAGIEVILDVVYNHTAEGNHLGPTLSLRGIDNTAYYRTVNGSPRYYMDYTGCGNTLNMRHPHVLQLIMDSLRYWVLEMHVDGFRFDLATVLARELHEVDKLGAFFDIIHQDPVLSQVKLIAEPWDLGEGGYQVGNFPIGWTEWNGKFRDCVRRFWKGDGGTAAEFATRITGSSDLYEASGRRPYASINFVTAHDGFTLHDLVSYNEKHNQANRENGQDGESHNNSWNCGAEGPTDVPEIIALRERQKRNILATLLLSEGVPMISQGDEMGRTQGGNNNAYCQDNVISYVNWEWDRHQEELFRFTLKLTEIWRANPVFQRRRFFQGRAIRGEGVHDILWYHPSGREMTDKDWSAPHVLCLGTWLVGHAMKEIDAEGNRIVGDSFLMIFNAKHLPHAFTLPRPPAGMAWQREIDTWSAETPAVKLRIGAKYHIKERSFALLRLVKKIG